MVARAESMDVFIEWQTRGMPERFIDITDARARYTLPCVGPLNLPGWLPVGCEERRECHRRGDQWVWADDSELVLVICWIDRKVLEYTSGPSKTVEVRLMSIEVWGDLDAMHARLDDLAALTPAGAGA